MGRTRRLWHRFRGSHDGKAQVAGDATGDMGDCSPRSPAVTTTATEPHLAIERDDKDAAKEVWLDAYKKLEEGEGTKKMVLAYETLLTKQLDDATVQPGVGTDSSLSNSRTPEGKISGMRRVTETALEKISRHSEGKQDFVKAAKVINTISSAVIRPMLQTEAVASLAWAGICVALEFSIRAATAGIEMFDGLCYVVNRMEWYMLLHALLLERPKSSTSVHDNQHAALRDRLRKIIQELYTSLLMYEIQCVCYCYRGSHITRTLRALVTLDDWKGKLNDIKELESRVQMDILQFEQNQTTDRLVRIAEDADEKFGGIHHMLQQLLMQKIRLQELVGLFNTSDYNKQMRFNPIRVPGTCEWFCNHNTFKDWLGSDAGLLLVSAAPGCGKSTLARYLVEEVLPKEDSDCKILYFFFKDTIKQKRLNTAICAVLHQLLLDNYTLVEELQEFIRQAGGNQVAENSSSLCNIFSAACRGWLGGIICVFDALDECEPDDSSELIRRIEDMLHVSSGINVRFLVTTRGYPQLLNQFRDFESSLIHLDGDGKREKDAIQHEISLVLDYKLEHLFKTKNLEHQPERKSAIEMALRSKGSEQRTYMWLKLVFDIMERIPWKSDNDWKKVIISTPKNVNDAYTTLLQNVPEEEKAYVKIVLHLMVAAYRPLTLREMNIALLVRDTPGDRDEKSLGLQSENEFKDWILQTCGFFVTVYDNRLSFIHQTAKEFLFGPGLEMMWPEGPNRLPPVTDKAAHKIMAESSIAYLSLRCFRSRQFREQAQKFPTSLIFEDYGFLDYSARNWIRHFNACQSFDGSNVQDVDDDFIPHYVSLFTTDDDDVPGWMFLQFRLKAFLYQDNRKALTFAEGYNLFDAAFWFDHIRLLVYVLSIHTCTDCFLFYAAAAHEAEKILQYLAATGHDINAQDESGTTALCLAARNEMTKTVNLLLDYNADVNLSGGPDKMPLSYLALMPGHVELVRRIVCRGADLNNTVIKPSSIGAATMTPLAWFSLIPYGRELGYEDYIRRLDALLDKFDASGFGEVGNLLQTTDLFATDEFLNAYNGSLIKLFLDHGAHIDGVDPSQFSERHRGPMTSLEHACHYVSKVSTAGVFWNALFLLYGGANSRLNAGAGTCALDWLICVPPEVGSMERCQGTHHTSPDFCWRRCSALAILLLNHNPASDFINNPISSNTLQTRLHSLTAPHIVSYRGPKVKLLLDHGAGANYQDLHGKTPMHYLVSHPSGNSELRAIVSMLIGKGAELEVRDSLGKTPIHYVTSPSLLNILVENGADIESRDHQGNTPSQNALNNRWHQAAVLLLRRRAASGVKSLLQRSFDTEQRDWDTGATLLAFVSVYHACDVAGTLLRRGADPNTLPNVGAADIERYLDRVDYIQIENKWGSKSERLEGRTWRTVGFERRLRYGCADYGDERPLHLAMHNPWTYDAEVTVKALLSHGADIEARSSLGQTPLQVACHRGNEDGARFLLKMGARVDNTAWDGDTALDFACAAWQPNEGLIRALLTHATASDSEYHDEPDLGRIAGRWLSEADDARDVRHGNTEDASTRCCRTAKSDVVNHDETGLANLVICRCKECCREHERRVCVAVQILLDAGAWIQLRYYKRDMEFPFETARERGWNDLANLLEQAAVPSWRRAWIPPNTRRRSLPAVILSEQ